MQAFWVEEGSQILATLTAVIHERYNHHWQEQMGHFLLFEAFPDHDAATQSRQRPAALQHLAQAIDHGVLLIIGVQRRYRGRGINLALAAKSYLAMMARGYKSASYTLVLDDNWPSRRTAEKLGGASPAIL